MRVHQIAGQQTDPLLEEALAVLFTDQPVREELRPGDSRRHWTWFGRRDEAQSSSRVWLNLGEPLSDETVDLLEGRANSALAALVDRGLAASATAVVRRTRRDVVEFVIEVRRSGGAASTLTVVLDQGLRDA